MVSLVKCKEYDSRGVDSAVRKAVDLLGGIDKFVKSGERVLIKPNLLSAKAPDRAVTTHPEVVRAVVRLVKEVGAEPYLGDSPGVGGVMWVARASGLARVAQQERIEMAVFDGSVAMPGPPDGTFKKLEVARAATKADAIINVAKLKTHAQMVLTLAVKNIFGCVVGAKKIQWHLKAGLDTDFFGFMLLDLFTLMRPRLNILDGIVGMEGNGPGNGTPRKIGLLAASDNGVALDAVVAELLGYSAEAVPHLRCARSKGIMEADWRTAKVVGEEVAASRIKHFVPARQVDIQPAGRGIVTRVLRSKFTPRPVLTKDLCKACGVCVEACPPKSLAMISGEPIFDYQKCIRCFCCQELCPEGAIAVQSGWRR